MPILSPLDSSFSLGVTVPPLASKVTLIFEIQCAYNVIFSLNTELEVTCVLPSAVVYQPSKEYPSRIGTGKVPTLLPGWT